MHSLTHPLSPHQHLGHDWLAWNDEILFNLMQPSQNQGTGVGISGGGGVAGSSSGSGGVDNSGENSPGSVTSYGSTQPRGMSGGPGPGPGALQPGLIRKVKQSTSDRSISTLFGCICDPFGTLSSSRDEDKEEGTDHTQFVSGSVIGENNTNNPNNHNNYNNKNSRYSPSYPLLFINLNKTTLTIITPTPTPHHINHHHTITISTAAATLR